MKVKELRNSPPKYEQNILAKTKTSSPSKRRNFFKKEKEKDWSEPHILQVTVKNQFIQLLGTSFDHHGLNKNWSSFFLPYSSLWQSSRRKKKKKKPKISKRMSVILLVTSYLWSAKRFQWWMGLFKKKKKERKILLLCSVTQIKRDVGGNQVICVQDI